MGPEKGGKDGWVALRPIVVDRADLHFTTHLDGLIALASCVDRRKKMCGEVQWATNYDEHLKIGG